MQNNCLPLIVQSLNSPCIPTYAHLYPITRTSAPSLAASSRAMEQDSNLYKEDSRNYRLHRHCIAHRFFISAAALDHNHADDPIPVDPIFNIHSSIKLLHCSTLSLLAKQTLTSTPQPFKKTSIILCVHQVPFGISLNACQTL